MAGTEGRGRTMRVVSAVCACPPVACTVVGRRPAVQKARAQTNPNPVDGLGSWHGGNGRTEGPTQVREAQKGRGGAIADTIRGS